ncbi:MAG: cytochrome c-type biogenesis protein CcmH, partial [Acidimicrobiales bacterium]|nr:cytochrome c-type biogenesis protein CcmH [Acidimicrobiales bacterium]
MSTEARPRVGVDLGPVAPAPPRAGRGFPWWTCFGVVVVVALVVGSGVLRSSPPSPAARAAAIEAQLRCPSCEDLSVAQSSAPTAVAVRAAIRHQMAEGRSDAQIESYLVSRYGSGIELAPPAHGWSLLVWLVPAVAGVVALGAVVVLFVRRERRG